MFVFLEAEAFAANHGCLCLETSAKDAVNIGQLFTMISMCYRAAVQLTNCPTN